MSSFLNATSATNNSANSLSAPSLVPPFQPLPPQAPMRSSSPEFDVITNKIRKIEEPVRKLLDVYEAAIGTPKAPQAASDLQKALHFGCGKLQDLRSKHLHKYHIRVITNQCENWQNSYNLLEKMRTTNQFVSLVPLQTRVWKQVKENLSWVTEKFKMFVSNFSTPTNSSSDGSTYTGVALYKQTESFLKPHVKRAFEIGSYYINKFANWLQSK